MIVLLAQSELPPAPRINPELVRAVGWPVDDDENSGGDLHLG